MSDNNQFSAFFEKINTVSACLLKRDELSDKGIIKSIKEQLIQSQKEQKIILGKELNSLKIELKIACDKKIQEIQEIQEKDLYTNFDPTFSSKKYQNSNGKLHPITQTCNEIVDIFANMGFSVADGPLVETQTNCFTKLNMPDYHPARSMQDTFFLAQKDGISENYVLRTHTTGTDVRYTSEHKPPIAMVCPGQVYRNEKIDSTHDVMFHQIECLFIDEKVSFSQLKTLIEYFYQNFFEQNDLIARFRPSYFPYVNPGLEVDISNPFKQNQWLEVGGAGLVHPNVIKNFGLDPNKYQGLAFGFGIDRMTQLKLGLSGLSQFFEGNLEFLSGR
jgi:phenylalanyl-tRNA synthetase alpha chain